MKQPLTVPCRVFAIAANRSLRNASLIPIDIAPAFQIIHIAHSTLPTSDVPYLLTASSMSCTSSMSYISRLRHRRCREVKQGKESAKYSVQLQTLSYPEPAERATMTKATA
jgi:hypothetical protein